MSQGRAWLQRFGPGSRVAAGLAGACFIVGAVAVGQASTVRGSGQVLSGNIVPALQDVVLVGRWIGSVRSDELTALGATTAADVAAAAGRVRSDAEAVSKAVDDYAQYVRATDEAGIYAGLRTAWDRYRLEAMSTLDLLARDPVAAHRQALGSEAATFGEVQQAVTGLGLVNRDQADAAAGQQSQGLWWVWAAVASFVLGLALIGAVTYRVVRRRDNRKERDDARDLVVAVSEHQLTLRYQPIVSAGSALITAVEALVRWDHPTRGLLTPDRFLPIAERAGLHERLGEQVIEMAIAGAAELRRRTGTDVRVWINLAPQQLDHPDRLLTHLRATLAAAAVPASLLGFEVTEQAVLADLAGAGAALSRLRDLGSGIALDDFGTGYASLTYLRQLPVNAVKIDRQFVSGVGVALADEVVVDAVTRLAHALGLEVVAEGVEERGQLESLLALGVERLQGYLLARPATLDVVVDLVGSHWCGNGELADLVPTSGPHPVLPGGRARNRLLFSAFDHLTEHVVVVEFEPDRRLGTEGNSRVVYANSVYLAATGLRLDQVLGLTVMGLGPTDGPLHDHNRRTAQTVAELLVTDPTAAPGMLWWGRRADGSTYPVEYTVTRFSDDYGYARHLILIGRDITGRHTLEAGAAYRGRINEALVTAARALLDTERVQAALSYALGCIADVIDAPIAWLDVVDWEHGVVRNVCQRQHGAEAAPLGDFPIALVQPFLDQFAPSDTLIATVDTSDVDIGLVPGLFPASGALLAAGVKAGGRVIATVGVKVEDGPRSWTGDEAAAIEVLADIMGTTLIYRAPDLWRSALTSEAAAPVEATPADHDGSS